MNRTSKIIIAILSLCCLALTACNTTHRVRNQPIAEQLNQYIGQTPMAITQQLDLNKIGIKFTNQPILKNNQLIYSFERTISTPIPSGIAISDERGKMVQTQLATTSDSLQNALRCNIIFDIENGIAKSYQLKGRAC